MDRKALIRQYKETRRPMGVYQVRNTVNGKCLVGTSVNLPAIFNRLRLQLETGNYFCTGLQADWNTLGAAAFAFEVLDEITAPDESEYDPADDLRALEELWLEKRSPFGERGYNAPKRGK